MSKRLRQISTDFVGRFSSRSCRAYTAILVILIISSAWKVSAQSAGNFDTGTITGTVSDPSGAVIPHGSVTITNTGTGIVTTATTGETGSLLFRHCLLAITL